MRESEIIFKRVSGWVKHLIVASVNIIIMLCACTLSNYMHLVVVVVYMHMAFK